VEFAVAEGADLRLTFCAFAVLSALIGAHVARLNPLSTSFGGTVQSVLGRVFLVLFVPLHFELQVEKMFNMLERNMLRGAAFGRHMRRIGDGHGEDTF